MLSEEASCSECKFEIIQRRWTQLLLDWLNTCVTPKADIAVAHLNPRSLVEIINKYKQDICANDLDRAMLCTDDLEPFLRYKYPILRLRYFSEDKDVPKKLYIMTSVLLFHCCVNSRNGVVVADIWEKMDNDDQEMILKFCEKLLDMETTISNVESAIREAYEAVSQRENQTGLGQNKSFTYERPAIDFQTSSCAIPSDSNTMSTISKVMHDSAVIQIKKYPILKFKSSVTVLPSCVTDASSYSKISLQPASSISTSDCTMSSKFEDNSDSNELTIYNIVKSCPANEKKEEVIKEEKSTEECSDSKPPCKPDCACTRCSLTGPCCGVPGSSVDCDDKNKKECKEENVINYQKSKGLRFNWKIYLGIVGLVMLVLIIISGLYYAFYKATKEPNTPSAKQTLRYVDRASYSPDWAWECKDSVCQKYFKPDVNSSKLYTSLSRCTLLCMGPQLWPHPIGYTYYSKAIVAIATSKLEYKFQSIPSEIVHQYLAEAFKLFLVDLARLEKIDIKSKNRSEDMIVKKMNIQIDVESDPDPRIRLNTDESYYVKIESTPNQVKIVVSSASFCGVRHGLETLSQLILLDQSSGYLITLSSVIIKDAPSYKYRGLMIDTARNFIPVPDLIRTIDGMATCKLNTFHWRISDSTSFPLLLPKLPKLVQYGAYDRTMVYTKKDVKSVTYRAGIRGIRVLIEVAAPGPIGRAWSWSNDATCQRKNDNQTCDNILCVRLKMQESVFEILQYIYSEILDMTAVDDVFHLSDSLFSFSNCYFLLEQRDAFLEKALDSLRLANKGFLPKLPIIWYSSHLKRDLEETTWDRLGIQLNDWKPNEWDQSLSKYRVIHSTKWDLSCEMKKQRCTKYKTWQEMYSWKSWRNVDVFSVEGGEAILWTDLVDSGNLDYHLWPRAAAVAERLWSDMVINNTANGQVYIRLDSHRWRMLLQGLNVQPVWPLWCSFNPASCLLKIHR